MEEYNGYKLETDDYLFYKIGLPMLCIGDSYGVISKVDGAVKGAYLVLDPYPIDCTFAHHVEYSDDFEHKDDKAMMHLTAMSIGLSFESACAGGTLKTSIFNAYDKNGEYLKQEDIINEVINN